MNRNAKSVFGRPAVSFVRCRPSRSLALKTFHSKQVSKFQHSLRCVSDEMEVVDDEVDGR
jgi:hypothetical protein